MSYDAILVLSFGGPDGPDDVMPFLENVTRGRGIPRERLEEVAEHYHHFDGSSPINQQNLDLIECLKQELKDQDIDLPVYFGNRNWHPLLTDTVRQMKEDGRKKVAAYVTSAYSSYSSCRQYRENIEEANKEVGEGAPEIDKLRVFYNHPLFIEAHAERIREALEQVPEDVRDTTPVLLTAHSLPTGMPGCDKYVQQLQETCRLTAEACNLGDWEMVYQSRSGPPHQPWLEPDVCDRIEERFSENTPSHIVIYAIGFLSDHIEVLHDLDDEAAEACEKVGATMIRAETVGHHPTFVKMVADLIRERISDSDNRAFSGQYDPEPDTCAPDCCCQPA